MIDDSQRLEEIVRKDDEEWHEAVATLRTAAKRPLGLADRIREDPLPWLAGGLILGMWVGLGND